MAESDFKVTVIGAINEVRRKSKLSPASTLDQDSDSITKLHYLNDVVSELSDFANWQELYREAIVSVSTSVRDYSVSGVVIQNIHEVAISTRQSALKRVGIDEMRLLQRNNNTGSPYHWCLKGINSEGNPIITFDRWPTNTDDGYFNIGYYRKVSAYSTADASATVPFPGRLVVQGLLTKTILDESDGEPTIRYATNLELYDKMKEETYNRFNGDTGGDIYFKPGNKIR
jgi:hypothetical protein